MTKIFFLRHGQVTEQKHLLGRTDWPVMASGYDAMQAQANSISFDHIVSSPLKRCAAFAEDLSQAQHIPLSIDANFAEIDFGDWDGENIAELWQQKAGLMQTYFAQPFDFTPPNAEHSLDFQQRVEQAVQQLIKQHPEKTVLVVCHAGVIKAALASALRIDHQRCNWLTSLQIDYASLNAISYWEQDNATVHFFNRI